MEQTQQTIKMSSHDMNLSDQALACIMMAVQKGMIEGSDITDTLRGLKLRMTEAGLFVLNPPTFKLSQETDEDELPGFVSDES